MYDNVVIFSTLDEIIGEVMGFCNVAIDEGDIEAIKNQVVASLKISEGELQRYSYNSSCCYAFLNSLPQH